MTERFFVTGVFAGLIALAVLAAPAAGLIMESSYMGMVSELDSENSTMTIQAGFFYGCTWENGTPSCTWNPRFLTEVIGRVPIEQAYSGLKVGDTVEATILGGPGRDWIGIGVLVPNLRSGVLVDREIYGDPSVLHAPYLGNYSLSYTMQPDCGNCTGTVCPAVSTNITLASDGMAVLSRILSPGETVFFNGRNDNSSVYITFLKGEALSALCPNSSPMIGGRQPVPAFVIRITPPIAPITTATPAVFQEGPPGFASIPIGFHEPGAPVPSGNWGMNIGNVTNPGNQTSTPDLDGTPWLWATFPQAPDVGFKSFTV